MIIKKDEIEFKDSSDFYKFIFANDLYGVVQLKEPIQDSSGNVMVKEGISLNESTIKKIMNLEGKHISILKIILNKGVVEKLRIRLAKETFEVVEKSNKFLGHLYENSKGGTNNYRGIIENSFYNSKIVMFLFRLLMENKPFFDHIINLALLSLGAVIQTSFSVRLIHRHSFLAGLFFDISLVDTDYWKVGVSNGNDLTNISKMSASLLGKLNMADPVVQALNTLDLQKLDMDFGENLRIEAGKFDLSGGSLTKMGEYEDAGSTEEGSGSEEDPEVSRAVSIIGEAIKISKFIQTLEKKLEGTEDKYEKLIISFAYNSEKGLFLKEFADLMTSTFKEFEVEVKKVKHIASVENECIFKDQAWAYPRNNPTQILCKGRKYECKHVEPGWDMNIISRKEAIGYIGTKLEPGQYPKCKLEAKLKGLDSIKKTVKKA
ncbi:MAG: hypothetical protein KDK54_12155 [Leptospiraceae bacterium]|nr:hypothetical protein [Leptospiraceae bacterium]